MILQYTINVSVVVFLAMSADMFRPCLGHRDFPFPVQVLPFRSPWSMSAGYLVVLMYKLHLQNYIPSVFFWSFNHCLTAVAWHIFSGFLVEEPTTKLTAVCFFFSFVWPCRVSCTTRLVRCIKCSVGRWHKRKGNSNRIWLWILWLRTDWQ